MPEKATLKLDILERDDLADIISALNLRIPDWAIGALVWLLVSELFLKPAFPDDFRDIQTGLVVADIITELPPGIAIVAYLYKTVHALEFKEEYLGEILNKIIYRLTGVR